MKKQDLVDAISAETGAMKYAVEDFLKALAKVAEGRLKGLEGFDIPGVVSMKVARRAARVGRNPATGASVQIPAKNVVTAKPVKSLREV